MTRPNKTSFKKIIQKQCMQLLCMSAIQPNHCNFTQGKLSYLHFLFGRFTCACALMYVCIYICIICMHVCVRIYIYIYTYVYVCAYVCMYIYICMYIHIYVDTCTHICTHTSAYIHHNIKDISHSVHITSIQKDTLM